MTKNIRDIIGGVAMLSIGLFAALYAGNHYDAGTLNRMGPGYFPVALGILLALLGVAIATPALFRHGTTIDVDWRTAMLVIVSIGLFGTLLSTLGLIPATFLASLLALVADRRLSWCRRAGIATGVALVTWLIFRAGLGMLLPVWPWDA
ncbi:tripartite tricarboxylate transporter TctB family protein [Vreelandella boliviensis]|uniref:tripartite tricarboxylate transporter TctB family protein n=1 Tax=Vreelandella boliviensis TaxID=223527 RepID=UPI001B8AA2B0|nr:tripartite tricarboxylate transporter TctB family protein [Halomonas boliviensis]MBS3669988.1 tripartite tricarboxylate transporter TctB family protein [Halomonas boliviensis]